MRKLVSQLDSQRVEFVVAPEDCPSEWLRLNLVKHIIRREEASLLDLRVTNFDNYSFVV